MLAVLDCRASDDQVRAQAVAVAAECGCYLTLVVVAPKPFPCFWTGPYCIPRVTSEDLRAHAARTLERAAALVPPDIPLKTAVDEGTTAEVIARRVETAGHDLVVVRRRRLNVHPLAPPSHVAVLAVAGQQRRRGARCSRKT